MTEKTLLEPSIAGVLKAIETATDLPASKKTHWSCSLRQICVYLNRPLEIVPARWSGIKNAVYELHAARVGANAKTLANHKSNVRAALLWFAEEKNLPKSGAPLMPAWAALIGKVADLNRRKRLSGLARYCSAAKIAPVDVNEEMLDRYLRPEYSFRPPARAYHASPYRLLGGGPWPCLQTCLPRRLAVSRSLRTQSRAFHQGSALRPRCCFPNILRIVSDARHLLSYQPTLFANRTSGICLVRQTQSFLLSGDSILQIADFAFDPRPQCLFKPPNIVIGSLDRFCRQSNAVVAVKIFVIARRNINAMSGKRS